jgi:hypothetical protein
VTTLVKLLQSSLKNSFSNTTWRRACTSDRQTVAPVYEWQSFGRAVKTSFSVKAVLVLWTVLFKNTPPGPNKLSTLRSELFSVAPLTKQGPSQINEPSGAQQLPGEVGGDASGATHCGVSCSA